MSPQKPPGLWFMSGLLFLDFLTAIVAMALAATSIKWVNMADGFENAASKRGYRIILISTLTIQSIVMATEVYACFYWSVLQKELKLSKSENVVHVQILHKERSAKREEGRLWFKVTSIGAIALGYMVAYVNFGLVIVARPMVDTIRLVDDYGDTSVHVSAGSLIQSDLDTLKAYADFIFGLLLANVVFKSGQIVLGHAWAAKKTM